jgi:tRNA (guanine-N7-)-methyltransferase
VSRTVPTSPGRPIRSFVLRQGRTTPAQTRALELLYPKHGIPFSDEKIASAREAPLVLEIGSGMGETTAAIAADHPEADFVAIEVHGPGVGSLLNRIEAAGLKNLRVVRHDAVEVLERMVAERSLAAIHVFFPDPWPKKRHHKRRLVQPEFVSLLAARLREGGIVHLATDWPDYAEHIALAFSGSALFEPCERGFAKRPQTKFEARGRRLGHPIRDLYYRRRGKAPAAR